jgi:hypothetical protein
MLLFVLLPEEEVAESLVVTELMLADWFLLLNLKLAGKQFLKRQVSTL